MTADMWQFSGGIAGAEGRPVLAPEGHEPKRLPHRHRPARPCRREAGGVEFLAHTESATPVDVMVTVTVQDPVEATTVLG
jgi:hypothetical protein